jgi:GTP diphosphokinase / guanosine-3',5'-bis(diphosphate) 3'-diphosphatase
MSAQEIIKLIDSPTPEDIALITKAHNIAEEAHRGVLRNSGEPYFNHVFETAKIITEIKMEPAVIAAGLLHDSIEDGVLTEEKIKQEFGEEILFLVQGVTKLGKLKYRGAERHIESLRKLFVASAQDIRVIIIKLCDRLHNMRTLQFVRPDKQKRIALETLEIFAPLAYRLGIRKLSKELEDLSFPYVYPKEYAEVKELMKLKSAETLPRLESFMKSVKKSLAEEGIINFTTDYRQKGFYSLSKKIIRKDGDIEKIYDILALRIFTDTVTDCYKVLGIIHGKWKPFPGRIKDYIAMPKLNGYQSLHTTIFTGDGAIVEVQIRTHDMHKQAEYGIASHLSYKDQKNNESKELSWFSQFLPKSINSIFKFTAPDKNTPGWIKDLAEESHKVCNGEEKLEDLKADFFGQRIFTFTPKGDAVDLPIGSSVIDFAYTIHSDIGNHMASAMINNKIASLHTILKNGDQVEIITKKNAKPNRKWLDHAKTTMAKRFIKSALNIKTD